MRKIFRFRQLYESIKKEGMKVAPVITDDGCRLDGSHRIAVVASLNKKTCVVNVARYEDIFSKERSRRIRKRVKEYRKEVYGL